MIITIYFFKVYKNKYKFVYIKLVNGPITYERNINYQLI